ncbi:MAG: hypothetical protein V1736_01470 [Pseudomonadota bacterium]
MRKWKIFVTFFKKLYPDHYTNDTSLNWDNFTFVKVNDDYDLEVDDQHSYDIFFEHDFTTFNPDLQKKGYHENSVLYHIYKNGAHLPYDYIGFIEYDHVLAPGFTNRIQSVLDHTEKDLIFAFNKFSFDQLWSQGVLMNPNDPNKETGDPESEWNCIRVVLEDYNQFFDTRFKIGDLIERDCFPICHCFLLPTKIFERIMNFHAFIMESGRIENYHIHNWRAKAGLMERYLAVELALEQAAIIDAIQLEHREYPIRVLKPDWFRPSLLRRLRRCFQKRT